MSGESENKRYLSRRKFIKLVVGAFAGAMVPSSSGDLSIDRESSRVEDSKSETNKLSLDEVQVGNIKLTEVVTEHAGEDWEKNGSRIQEILSHYPIVIPEYFPEEYARLANDGIAGMALRTYKDDNALFDELQTICLASQKEIYVVDPAYSEAAIIYRAVQNLPMAIASGIGIHELFEIYFQKSKEDIELNAKTKDMPPEQKFLSALRDKAASLVAQLGTTAVTAGGALFLDKNLNERDLRRVFIAHSLVNLGNILPPGTSALTIYPREHWKGIKYYLENEKEREEKLAKYKEMATQIPIFSDFFRIRHYSASDGHWEEQGDVTRSEAKKTFFDILRDRFTIRF